MKITEKIFSFPSFGNSYYEPVKIKYKGNMS